MPYTVTMTQQQLEQLVGPMSEPTPEQIATREATSELIEVVSKLITLTGGHYTEAVYQSIGQLIQAVYGSEEA